MSAVDRECIVFWLKKAEEWSSSLYKCSSASSTSDVAHNVDQLEQFLSALHSWLLSVDNTDVAFKRLPKLGQLLGRLCSTQPLIAHDPKVCSKLMRCIQALRPENPQHVVEKKAKEWAKSQIRHTVSFYNQTNPGSRVAESLGYQAVEYNELSAEKLIESIHEDLEHLMKEQQHFLLGLQQQNISQREISEMCLPLLHAPSSKCIVECLLVLHPQSSTDGLSPSFMKRVTQTQAAAYDKGWSADWDLAYDARVSLWLNHLPALQQEILRLLQAITVHSRHIGTKDAVKIIKSRELPRACSEHRVLYQAVDSCIQQVIWKTSGSQNVVRFLHWFQVAVTEAICSSHPSHPSIQSLFPTRLLPLVNLLLLSPADLPSQAHPIHLANISRVLIATALDPVVANNPRDMRGLWVVLAKFQSWYHAAVAALITGCDKEQFDVANACLGLVTWFNLPLALGEHDHYKLQNTVLSIARIINTCMMGTDFKSTELQRALSHFLQPTCSDDNSPVTNVSTALLMSAVLQSSSVNENNILEILDTIYPGENAGIPSKLSILLDSLDIYTEHCPLSALQHRLAGPSPVIAAVRTLNIHLQRDVKERKLECDADTIQMMHTRCERVCDTPKSDEIR